MRLVSSVLIYTILIKISNLLFCVCVITTVSVVSLAMLTAITDRQHLKTYSHSSFNHVGFLLNNYIHNKEGV